MSARRTLLIELSYMGSYFYGVQPQPGLRTVGGELRARLTQALQQPSRGLTFAARTDSGVSAENNFASCWVRSSEHLLCEALPKLGLLEPSALSLRSVHLAPRSMNARSCARSKHYRYTIERCDSALPDAWNVAEALDVARMRRAARDLVGTHDFSSFRSKNCDASSPIKTLHRIDIGQAGSRTWIDVEGTSFLRKMVRILCGTLVEVGTGARKVSDMPAVLEARQRPAAGVTAPARGLCLRRVELVWPGMRHPGAPLMRLASTRESPPLVR